MIGRVFQEDLNNIISDCNIPFCEMHGASVLITGATGLIGSALVHTLIAANEKYDLKLNIIGNGRNSKKGEDLRKHGMDSFVNGDIRKPLPDWILPTSVDYIFHCAAITKSTDMVSKPVYVMETTVDGTQNTLDLARSRNCKSFVYLSSMEVYGQTGLNEVKESDLGYLDLSNPRASYPESKRFCEVLCTAYARQYDIPVKIARLAQTFGAGTPQDDTRIFAQFARSAMSGDDIVLHTKGKSTGNYCYISDTIRALLLLLFKGENSQTYNVSNPDASMTICAMAEVVAKEICSGRIKVKFEIPDNVVKLGYAPESSQRLRIDKIKKLGWQPRYGLTEMYRRLLADWKDIQLKGEMYE